VGVRWGESRQSERRRVRRVRRVGGGEEMI